MKKHRVKIFVGVILIGVIVAGWGKFTRDLTKTRVSREQRPARQYTQVVTLNRHQMNPLPMPYGYHLEWSNATPGVVLRAKVTIGRRVKEDTLLPGVDTRWGDDVRAIEMVVDDIHNPPGITHANVMCWLTKKSIRRHNGE